MCARAWRGVLLMARFLMPGDKFVSQQFAAAAHHLVSDARSLVGRLHLPAPAPLIRITAYHRCAADTFRERVWPLCRRSPSCAASRTWWRTRAACCWTSKKTRRNTRESVMAHTRTHIPQQRVELEVRPVCAYPRSCLVAPRSCPVAYG